MRYKYLLIVVVVLFSCKKEEPGGNSIPPVITEPPVLLKEIIIPGLPSPYYHFEYDTMGKASFVSFASDFTRYNIVYNGGRISEMRNNTFGNTSWLQYTYDNAGRVSNIKYINSGGVIFTRVTLSYNGTKLINLQREQQSGSGFITDKTMAFEYYADGNLKVITEHRPPFEGAPELNFTDAFEQYDTTINVEGFSLLHKDFFDHLVLLPAIQLQKNNPGKLNRTGSGINYKIAYSYSCNNKGLPVRKDATGTWLNGADAGKIFHENAFFSYYE